MDFVTKPIDLPELRARIGSALHIHRLMKLLELRAQIDGLTALKNRAYFNERISSTYNSLCRTGHTASLVMCDLDHFKKLNDNFGHQAGDAVLVSFSSIVTTALRSCDVACRYGGEEFALILPDTDAAGSMIVCDRIRQHTHDKVWPAYPEMHATASFGIANIPIHKTGSANEWIESADKALYQAKEAGRNRVVIFEPESDPQKLRPAS
jgi:diguanylate cyclase (GGDEF)-like protein